MPYKTHGRQNGRERMRAIEITDPHLVCLSVMRLLGLSRGAHSKLVDIMVNHIIDGASPELMILYAHGSLYTSTWEHAEKALREFQKSKEVIT